MRVGRKKDPESKEYIFEKDVSSGEVIKYGPYNIGLKHGTPYLKRIDKTKKRDPFETPMSMGVHRLVQRE